MDVKIFSYLFKRFSNEKYFILNFNMRFFGSEKSTPREFPQTPNYYILSYHQLSIILII